MTTPTPPVIPAAWTAAAATEQTIATAIAPPRLSNRTLPGSGENDSGSLDSLNLIFVVGMALLITVLARYLSTRGRRK